MKHFSTRRYFAIASLLLTSGAIFAQNVGIGQPLPKSKLDVNGNLQVGATYSGVAANAAPANGARIEGHTVINKASGEPATDILSVYTSGATETAINGYGGTGSAGYFNNTAASTLDLVNLFQNSTTPGVASMYMRNVTPDNGYGLYSTLSSTAALATGSSYSGAFFNSNAAGPNVAAAWQPRGLLASASGLAGVGVFGQATGAKYVNGTAYFFTRGGQFLATGTLDPNIGLSGSAAGLSATLSGANYVTCGITGSVSNTSVASIGQNGIQGTCGASGVIVGRTGTYGGVAAIASYTGASPAYQSGIVGLAIQPATVQAGVQGGLFQLLNSTLTIQTDAIVAGRVGTTNYGILSGATKSTTVPDFQDPGNRRIMYCTEAPEVLFEDHGFGTLVNGKAHIDLDPIFTHTVKIDAQHPLRVFVQLEGDCNGVFVTNKTATSFEVKELQNGNANVSFTYRIVANRADEVLDGQVISEYANNRYPKIKNMIGVKAQPTAEQNPMTGKEYVEEMPVKRTLNPKN